MEQQLDPRIRQIVDLLSLYSSEGGDLTLLALEIHQLYREDIEIADSIEGIEARHLCRQGGK